MADKRKLQGLLPNCLEHVVYFFMKWYRGTYHHTGEIERCLKKVAEGVETFEDIWQKVILNRSSSRTLPFSKLSCCVCHRCTTRPTPIRKKSMKQIWKRRSRSFRLVYLPGYAPYLVDCNEEYVNERVVLVAPASSRSNKDVANVEWYQGQRGTDGQQKIDWNSE